MILIKQVARIMIFSTFKEEKCIRSLATLPRIHPRKPRKFYVVNQVESDSMVNTLFQRANNNDVDCTLLNKEF